MRTYACFVEEARKRKVRIGEIVLAEQVDQLEKTEEELVKRMRRNLNVMRESVQAGLKGDRHSISGLIGGDGAKVESYRRRGKTLMGDQMTAAIARALAVAEVNATMGKIVAAPTAGSCGVLPAMLFTLEEVLDSKEEDLINALFTAAGLGMVIADRATVSGAEGGCQAEIGAAAAMGAAAAVELAGGTPEQTAHAGAIALKSLLGLVCDPVAGLVEVPCVKRNATATTLAMTAAEMALAGVESVIPIDEVIDTMAQIGKQLPCSLRETAQGGLAATPTGEKIKEEFR